MKIKRLLLTTVLVAMLLPTTAFAYIDPSATTYIIQAVAGIVIAVGAGIAIYFHKIKKKVNQALNIDENAKKETEEDLIIFSEDDKNTDK